MQLRKPLPSAMCTFKDTHEQDRLILPVHFEEGAHDGLVVVAIASDSGSLHTSPHNVQWVGRGLTNQACHSPKHHPL